MIDYDHLWRIETTYHDWRRLKTSFRSVGGMFGPLSQPKILKIRPRTCLFIARLTIVLPDLEISFKSWKIRKTYIFENRISKSMKNWSDHIPRVQFCMPNSFLDPKLVQNRPKTRFLSIFVKIRFYILLPGCYAQRLCVVGRKKVNKR